jgi:hypothetical protein
METTLSECNENFDENTRVSVAEKCENFGEKQFLIGEEEEEEGLGKEESLEKREKPKCKKWNENLAEKHEVLNKTLYCNRIDRIPIVVTMKLFFFAKRVSLSLPLFQCKRKSASCVVSRGTTLSLQRLQLRR